MTNDNSETIVARLTPNMAERLGRRAVVTIQESTRKLEPAAVENLEAILLLMSEEVLALHGRNTVTDLGVGVEVTIRLTPPAFA